MYQTVFLFQSYFSFSIGAEIIIILINFQQVNPAFDVTNTQTLDPPVIEISSSSSFSTPVSCLLRGMGGRRKTGYSLN